MKSILTIILCSIVCGALAQQDFDYKLYCSRSRSSFFTDYKDSMLELTTSRCIVKENSKLTIFPTNNTGNAREFSIHFQGFHFGVIPKEYDNGFFGKIEMISFEYSTADGRYYISIWPIIPLVVIKDFKTWKVTDVYY